MKTGKKIYIASLSFLLPIVFVCIINFGIIFDLPNYTHLFVFITDFLFKKLGSGPPLVEILIGIATIFIVFFTFVQVMYNIRHLPPWYMWEYILFHPRTIAFVFFFLSEMFIILWFVNFNNEDIYRLNYLVSTSTIIISVIVTILYFIWLIWILTIAGMVDCIQSFINPKDIKGLDQKLANNKQKRSEQNLQFKIKFVGKDHFIIDDRTALLSPVEGILMDINIPELKNLFKPIDPSIKDINVLSQIGETINGYIFAIDPVSADQIENVNSFLITNKIEILKCFQIDSVEYARIYKPFNDFLRLYEHIANETPRELKNLISLIRIAFSKTILEDEK